MTDLTTDYTFKENATKTHKGYNNFGINHMSAKMFGYAPNEIETVNLKVSEDQSRPTLHDRSITPDYWGWFDFQKNKFTFIHPQLVLLHMCFAGGLKFAESKNTGKAYRLEIFTNKQ